LQTMEHWSKMAPIILTLHWIFKKLQPGNHNFRPKVPGSTFMRFLLVQTRHLLHNGVSDFSTMSYIRFDGDSRLDQTETPRISIDAKKPEVAFSMTFETQKTVHYECKLLESCRSAQEQLLSHFHLSA
jgi:hypothetical protein